jgi:hypothetical protein
MPWRNGDGDAAISEPAILLIPRRYLCRIEKPSGQSDHAIHHIGFDRGTPDRVLAALVGGHRAIGEHYAGRSIRCEVVDNVLKPGGVGIADGWHAELPEHIVAQTLAAPVRDIERRIGTFNRLPGSQSGGHSQSINAQVPATFMHRVVYLTTEAMPHVQDFGSAREVSLARHGDEVAEMPQLHTIPHRYPGDRFSLGLLNLEGAGIMAAKEVNFPVIR